MDRPTPEYFPSFPRAERQDQQNENSSQPVIILYNTILSFKVTGYRGVARSVRLGGGRKNIITLKMVMNSREARKFLRVLPPPEQILPPPPDLQ